MLNTLLYLRPGELRRLLPFFGFYVLLFAAFALADGVALAMFVKHLGGRALPGAYAVVALANVIVIGLYIALAERLRSAAVFRLILLGNIAVFGAGWIALHTAADAGPWYEALFVCREIAFTLMLMHFGTFLQDYFTREELGRVLPLVYSGGRLGGLLGGAMLVFLAEPLDVVNLLGVFVGFCVSGIIVLTFVDRTSPHVEHVEETDDAGAVPAPNVEPGSRPEDDARQSYLGFLRYAWLSPLLFWITITTVLFIVCRWILNFQYSSFFEFQFEDDEDLAEFLGLYTQGALLVAIVLQVLVVNRLIAWLGLKGAHLIYSVCLLAGMFACAGEMTILLAMLARFVETELRFGLRNPIHQLITNQFPKTLRVRVRAWSFGIVIPLGTLLSSIALGGLNANNFASWIPWFGGACALTYFACTFGLMRSFREESPA